MPTKIVETFPNRVQLEKVRAELAVAVPVTVKDTFACIQGDVLGKITASGLYRRRSRTTTAGTGFSNASPTGQVTDASVFAAGDVLKDANGNAIGTVQAINTVANPNTVTLTGNAANNVAAGVGVVAQDGSQVAQGIADLDSDGSGDTSMDAIIGGYLDESLLRGLDSTAKTELGGASVAGGVFKF